MKKSKNKVIAVAVSDIHLHSFSAFAKKKHDRLDISTNVLKLVGKVATQFGVPLLFPGDLYHDPKTLTNTVINSSIKTFKIFDMCDLVTFGISGNHDQEQKNTKENKSPSYLSALDDAFPRFKLVDYQMFKHPDFTIFGIPYLHDGDYFFELCKKFNKKAKKYDNAILMVHQDLPACPNPGGYQVEPAFEFPKKFEKLFSNFKLVLSGHIHKPTFIEPNIYMLGSPIQQNEGDMGCQMGYYLIYSDFTIKFKPLNGIFPCFRQLNKGEEPYNDKDYFIPYEEEETISTQALSGKFSSTLSSKKLAKRYMKAKGIKSKRKRNLLTTLLNEAKND